jgi:Co/Zn/Cd efflux system component
MITMDECCRVTRISEQHRRLFRTVLLINITMFVVELVAGVLADSTAVLADSADMLGDALVYGFSLCGGAWVCLASPRRTAQGRGHGPALA